MDATENQLNTPIDTEHTQVTESHLTAYSQKLLVSQVFNLIIF